MEVDATDGARNLVEAYVVETFKASSHDLSDPMVWHEKVFFPSHEDVLSLPTVLIVEIGTSRLFGQRPPRWKSIPVLIVGFVRCAQRFVFRLKCVFGTNDFTFEVSG